MGGGRTHRAGSVAGSWLLRIARLRSAEGEGENREDFDRRSVIAATEERGKIEARFGGRPVGESGTDGQVFGVSVVAGVLAPAAVLHLQADLEFFFGQKYGNLHALRETGAGRAPPAQGALGKDVRRKER